MKFFKKHKTKDKATFNVGIRECRTCENNLRCEECAYPSENETLKAEVERLKDKYECIYQPIAEVKRTVKSETIKEFVEKFDSAIDEMKFPISNVVDTTLLIAKQLVHKIAKEMVGEQE